MPIRDRFPFQILTARGWGLLGAGSLSLLAAQVMGRRDLLALAILLIALPLLSLAGTRMLKPRFQAYREFIPPTVETGQATTVRLAIARTGTGPGQAIMEEHLPARFGVSPAFLFPARPAGGGTSHYEYPLQSRQRGQFRIGPVTAEFRDPFGLSRHHHAIGGSDLLTVTPAAVVLPAAALASARGHDGVTATRSRGNPSDDDVMTREYRHGDPMRRVHWPATARHGTLMVRQEEAVTTPEAAIILDQRRTAFSPAHPHPGHPHAPRPGGGAPEADSREPATSDAFEWAVTAAVSVSTHLVERNYTLRFLDTAGEPAFLRSPSAPHPEAEEYIGTAGLQSVAESLAAIRLSGPQHARRGAKDQPRGGSPAVAEACPQPFDDGLLDKLSAHRLRGPIVAILGRLSLPEAQALAPAASYGAEAFALLVTEPGGESGEVLQALRLGGWQAVSVSSLAALPAAWSAFSQDDQSYPVSFPAAAEGHRGAGGKR